MKDINTEYELYFHHEFIDDNKFPEQKKLALETDGYSYYIKNDFTIYQKKHHPKAVINREDFLKNRATFIRILYHLPLDKVEPYIKFHYDNYSGSKKSFVKYVYHDFKASKLKRGDIILSDPPQKTILLEWLENKRNRKSKILRLIFENLKWGLGLIPGLGKMLGKSL